MPNIGTTELAILCSTGICLFVFVVLTVVFALAFNRRRNL
jgi:hypothetical protein